jgi:hypothetical protein
VLTAFTPSGGLAAWACEETQEDIARSMNVSATLGPTGSTPEMWASTELVVDHATCTALLRSVGFGSSDDLGTWVLSSSKLYDRQMRENHLKNIICSAISMHYHADIKFNRMKPVADPKKFKKDLVEKVLALILKQLGKCYYSHIPLTIKNLYTRFSMERLDNNKPHFNADGTIPDTTVVVCRLFNVPAQMSRKKLLNYYLNQKLVAVPAEARKRATLELSCAIKIQDLDSSIL